MTASVMLIYGTRPEAIKMAPVVQELRRHPELRPTVVVTGQHREMLDQVNEVFGIVPDHDLNILSPGQSLTEITVRSLTGLEPLLSAERPDLVLVQGDTTTCFAASLASFYQRIPVAHLEAGLRTDNRYNPFPEEINRRLTTQVASLHLAPTALAKQNLLNSGVDASAVTVTGNTVIDALLEVTASERPIGDPTLARIAADRPSPLLLVTSHRRESWGEPLARTARAVAQLVRAFPSLHVLLPAHRNPVVRDALLPPLAGLDRVHVTEPLDYPDFCRVIWTDHVREMTDLPPVDRQYLMVVVLTVEEVLRLLLNPDKINLASFGNVVPHLHWHVIPRWLDDKHFPEPIWGKVQRDSWPARTTVSQQQLQAALAEALAAFAD